MPRKDYVDTKTRMRVAAWLKLIMRERNFPSAAALARHIGVNRSTVGRALRADRLGFDLVLAVHRKLHVDANQLLDQDPLPNGSIPGPQGSMSGQRSGRKS